APAAPSGRNSEVGASTAADGTSAVTSGALNDTGTLMRTATGTPSRNAGSNSHCATAAIAAPSNSGASELATSRDVTAPVSEMVTKSTTVPDAFALAFR